MNTDNLLEDQLWHEKAAMNLNKKKMDQLVTTLKF